MENESPTSWGAARGRTHIVARGFREVFKTTEGAGWKRGLRGLQQVWFVEKRRRLGRGKLLQLNGIRLEWVNRGCRHNYTCFSQSLLCCYITLNTKQLKVQRKLHVFCLSKAQMALWFPNPVKQVRLVSVKAERPNPPSRSHARHGGVNQPGGVLYNNTDMTL